jgi:hypothetical protein
MMTGAGETAVQTAGEATFVVGGCASGAARFPNSKEHCRLRLPPHQAKVCDRMRTIEAIIDPDGQVRLVEPVTLPSPRRALVTILEEPPSVGEAALLSEAALAEDWYRPEEDAAWAHLRPGKSS